VNKDVGGDWEASLTAKAETALRRAAAKAAELHRRHGLPLVVWKDGKVTLVPAEQLPVVREGDGGYDTGAGEDGE